MNHSLTFTFSYVYTAVCVSIAVKWTEPAEGPLYSPVGGLTYAQGPYVRYGKNFVGACRHGDVL